MDTLLNNGVLRLSLTFNPAHAQQKVVSGELPKNSYSFGFTQGMIGNVHFVTIPANASASAGAKVVANFLLSPEAQLRKADPPTGATLRFSTRKNYLRHNVKLCRRGSPKDYPPCFLNPMRHR